MSKQEEIKKLYFNKGYNQTEIGKILNISNKYVSKVLLMDRRYKEEKERRKTLSKNRHKQKTIDYIQKKRKNKGIDIVYEGLRQMHIQATHELSSGRNRISNKAYRDWNKSAYRYDQRNKSYRLKKGLVVGSDVPKTIKWT